MEDPAAVTRGSSAPRHAAEFLAAGLSARLPPRLAASLSLGLRAAPSLAPRLYDEDGRKPCDSHVYNLPSEIAASCGVVS